MQVAGPRICLALWQLSGWAVFLLRIAGALLIAVQTPPFIMGKYGATNYTYREDAEGYVVCSDECQTRLPGLQLYLLTRNNGQRIDYLTNSSVFC
jgi:predicted lipoprotein with Yx(FWY)xxD motif